MNEIGVVIRTKNEEKYIEQCIKILKSQCCNSQYVLKILVIDSGSTDNTVGIVKTLDCRLIQIPDHSFNFGGTLNLGFNELHTDYIICLSAHAIPFNSRFIIEMLKWFNDEHVSAVYAKQIPWPNAEIVEEYRINHMFKDKLIIFEQDSDELKFSNVASCIRFDVWEKHNFEIVPAAEDKLWAEVVLREGFKIVYEPNAIVYHSHEESAKEIAKRNLDLFYCRNSRNNFIVNIILIIKESMSYIKKTCVICIKRRTSPWVSIYSILKSIKVSFLLLRFFKTDK